MNYDAYVMDGEKELFITAELCEDGRYEEGFDSESGPWVEVFNEPVFCNFYCEDDEGIEVPLEQTHVEQAAEQMTAHYWNMEGFF